MGIAEMSRPNEVAMTRTRRLTLKSFLLSATILASPVMLAASTQAVAQIAISVNFAPPLLPVYVQPPIPEYGYIWTPGYWAYADAGYYWVPGTWVQPPEVDVLWTPPYWGWNDGVYLFHDGYWGQTVGFYGGVDYGYGYGGDGYQGGRWERGAFSYNRNVNNFGSVAIANAYASRVTVLNNSHVSFNGGPRGLRTRPTAAQAAVEHQHHLSATADQAQHMTAAAGNPALAASRNHGHPTIAATAHPGHFEGAGVVPARGAVAARHPGASGPAQHATAHAPPARHAAVEHAVAHPVSAPAARHPIEQARAHPAPVRTASPQRASFHPARAAPQPTHQVAAHPQAMHAAARPAQAPARPQPVAQHAAAPHAAPAARAPAARPEPRKEH